MEGADRALRVLLEVVEERGLVPVADAVENREVQLHQLLDVVEDPPERGRLIAAGQLFDSAIGEQVDIQLRAIVLDGSGQRRGQDAGRGAGLAAVEMPQEKIAQHRHVVTGAVLEAVADDDRLQVVVADGADDRVLERADLHDLVRERIVGATQALHLVPGALPLRVFGGRDDERFEVRLLPVAGLHVRRQQIG